MLMIRMQRTGRANMPTFRIVVTEKTESPKTGNVVEKVGTYNPKTKERNIDAERITYWMSVGAKPSATVHNMLVSLGILDAKKINILPAYKAPAEAAAEAKADEAAKVAEQEEKAEAKAAHDAAVRAEAAAKPEEAKEETASEAAEKPAPAEKA